MLSALYFLKTLKNLDANTPPCASLLHLFPPLSCAASDREYCP
jgi:hypothetical protein